MEDFIIWSDMLPPDEPHLKVFHRDGPEALKEFCETYREELKALSAPAEEGEGTDATDRE